MKNRTPWQRMALSLVGLAIIVLTWMQAVAHLYTLPPASLAAFTTITVNAQYVVGAIVVFMVTGKIFMDWKMNTNSVVQEIGEQIHQSRSGPAPKQFDDPELP